MWTQTSSAVKQKEQMLSAISWAHRTKSDIFLYSEIKRDWMSSSDNLIVYLFVKATSPSEAPRAAAAAAPAPASSQVSRSGGWTI